MRNISPTLSALFAPVATVGATAAFAAVLWATPAAAADPVAAFYKGKTVSLTVAFSPGGNYDVYARTVARHIGKHIPGNPHVIVQNLPGAGGRKMANQFYAKGPFDGTTIGLFSQGIATDQALGGKSIAFDANKFYWLGSPYDTVNVGVTWHTSPVKTIQDAMKIEIAVGGTGPSSGTVFNPKVMNALLGTKFKIISGYPGGTGIDQALESGELGGRATMGWNSLKLTRDWLKNKKVNIIIQIGPERSPELPNVPLWTDLAKNETDKKVLEFLAFSAGMGRPFGLPPKVPADRAKALRKAFEETMTDPKFLAECAKQKLDVALRDGANLSKLVAKQVNVDRDILARAKKAMGM